MKVRRISLLCAFISLFISIAFGQGFVNLDFEQATITPTPAGGSTYPADPTQCFPGWTIGYGVVMYNDLSLGAPAMVLMGPDFPNLPSYTPLQGSYSVLLQFYYLNGGYAGYLPSLSQSGLVPSSAQSISLLVASGTPASAAVVTMDGVNIPLVTMSDGRLAGNISDYAGTVAQLKISTPSLGGGLYFDDIQFSTTSVPEPSSFYFAIIGILLFIRSRKRPNQIR